MMGTQIVGKSLRSWIDDVCVEPMVAIGGPAERGQFLRLARPVRQRSRRSSENRVYSAAERVSIGRNIVRLSAGKRTRPYFR